MRTTGNNLENLCFALAESTRLTAREIERLYNTACDQMEEDGKEAPHFNEWAESTSPELFATA